MNQVIDTHEHSSFRVGRIEVKYYVREPSPGKWNAVGVIYLDDAMMSTSNRCPMIVGVGSTYHEAVGDLLARVLSGNHPDLPQASMQDELERMSGASETLRRVADRVPDSETVPASR